MPQVDPVILKLIADISDYNGKISAAQKLTDQKLDAIEAKGDAMGRGIKKSFSLAVTSALSFAAGLATIDLAKSFLAIADEAKSLDAQLRLATQGFGSFAVAQEDVRRIAAETRSGLSDTAALYGNFVRGAKELGATQQEAARATETFSKTLKISGADASQAGSATLQFGQALAAGALRGDELNSILEASPRLARLLSESLGQPIGAIKKLGEEGALTSDKLLRALTDQKFTEGIDEEFRQLPVTFGEAMTQVSNAAIITFGAFDRGGQFSTALANFVTDGTTGFANLENAAETFGITVRSELSGIAGAFAPVIAEAERLLRVLGGVKAASGNDGFFAQDMKDIDAFTGGLARQGMLGAVLTGNDPFSAPETRRGTSFFPRYQADRQREQGELALDRILRADIYNGAPELRPTQTPGPRSRPVPASTRRTPRASGASSAETEARKAEQERLRAIRDQAAKERELARYQDDLIAAKASLATAADDLLRFALDDIDNDRARRTADIQTDFKLGQLSEAEVRERTALVDQTAELRRQRAQQIAEEAKIAQEIAELEDTADTLETERRLARSRQERAKIEETILGIQQEVARARLEEAIAAGQIADATTARANLERRQANEQDELARENLSPLQRYRDRLNKTSGEINDDIEGYVVDELEAVQDSIASGIAKIIGTKDRLLTGLINLFIEQVIMRPIANAFANASGGGGGLGGIISGLGGIISGLGGGFGGGTTVGRASGGYVGAGHLYRVNEGASPGRVEGFRPLGSGEIIPLGQMNAMARGGQQPGGEIMVRVTLTEDLDARIDNRAVGVAVEVQRLSAPGVIDAAARETLARAGRPRLG